MAALKKNSITEFAWNNFCLFRLEIILNLFYECTLLLFCLEVAVSIHIIYFKSRKQGILPKHSASLRIFMRQGRRTQG